MTLDKDFEDFVGLLNKHNVDYMIIGGYALAFHGKPRHTGDLDIWIDVSDKNAQKMLSVVNEFGMASLGMEKADFLQKGIITQIGYPPLRIDILNEIDGVNFKEAYPNKLVIDVDGLQVNYIGLDDLIKNKQVSGRHQDISDVNELNKLKKNS
ncbi:MAG: nucleotidyltransferase family protein [Mucilaginibacter sp.]|jgi:predicted nucleotidyltransferase|nr:nucleotidyltransferase family protein [Mucilaginibacter sp.]